VSQTPLRPIATWPKPAASPATIVAPFFLQQFAVAASQPADDFSDDVPQGSCTFTFPAVAAGQILQGTLNCTTAPDQLGNTSPPPDTAVFTAASNADQFAAFSGRNTRGPIQLVTNNQLIVDAVGLIPGVTYVMNFQGTAVTNGTPVDLWPAPYAESVTDSTEQIYLGTESYDNLIEPFVVSTQALWRAFWVVTANGQQPEVVGYQSGLTYQPLNPPYLAAPAKFWRFPMIYGLDTEITVALGGAGGPNQIWWGADLADIDATVYNPSGGGGGGGTVYGQDNYVIVGAIVLPTDASNTIGPFYAHVGAGQSTSYTGVFASTLSGSVVGDIQQNGVTVPGLSGITITTTPTAFAPTSEIVVADHDAFSFVPTDVSGSPIGLTIEFDRTDAS
jgi:hypothetical protein